VWSLLALCGIWVVAVFTYEPWRRKRVRTAISPGVPWHAALLAAEAASFPRGERFDALCEAADGVAAHFTRASAHDYRLVENGSVVGAGTTATRLQTSDRSFSDRIQWADAVTHLGQRLRCDQVLILFPPTDVLPIEIEADGKRVRAAAAWH